MPERDYEVEIEPGDRLRVRLITERGDVLDFVVQLETRVGDDYVPTVRYDCSHGFAHRDTLNGRGEVVEKAPMPEHMTYKQCLAYAENDLRSNWRQYKKWFMERA
jgi:hypothetical protein